MTNITPSDKYAKLSVEQTISSLATDGKSGIASKEARARLDLNGHNEFQTENAELVYIKYMKQFTENPLIVLLLASAAVSLVMGNKDDAFSVLLAVFIVTTVAFVQEYRSEKSLEELNRLVPHFCNIMRDGRALTINANQLVPGDLVLFGVGDRVPADI